MTHTLEPLPYAYNALEPYIDEQTMHIHHDKHHQTYVDNLNKALEGHPELQKLNVEQLLKDLNKVPENIRTTIKNQGGGVANHNFFWTIMKKGVPAKGALIDAITKQWGSLEKFQEEFTNAAKNRFGSGWAWLVLNNGKLEIYSTPNQDSPLSEGKKPILTLDVWEHSYYLLYQNRRPDYIKNWWNVVNWEQANKNYEAAKR